MGVNHVLESSCRSVHSAKNLSLFVVLVWAKFQIQFKMRVIVSPESLKKRKI